MLQTGMQTNLKYYGQTELLFIVLYNSCFSYLKLFKKLFKHSVIYSIQRFKFLFKKLFKLYFKFK